MSTITAPAPTRLPAPGQRLHSDGLHWEGLRYDRLGALLVGLAMVVWLLVGAMAGASDADTPVPDPVSVVIQSGDTVWDLARAHAPSGIATLEYVMLVEQHNGVRSGALLPGTVLELPQS